MASLMLREQLRMRERGRLRIGFSTISSNGKKVPHKSETFILSSVERDVCERAAARYGGEVKPWRNGDRDEWVVTLGVRQLPVLVVPRLGLSQNRELFQGGFLKRTCDGTTCLVPGRMGRMSQQPCVCDPEMPECQLTTHVTVMLPELNTLGTFRLVTHGYNAAVELGGFFELIEGLVARGMTLVPALLGIESREKRRIVDDKPMTFKFQVPTLDVDLSQLGLDAIGAPSDERRAVPVGGMGMGRASSDDAPAIERTGFTPLDQEALPAAPFVSVADQLADNDREIKPRANAAPQLKPSGRTRATPRNEEACSLCGEPYGGESLVRNPGEGSRFVHAHCQLAGRGGTTSGAGDDPAEPSPPPNPAPRSMTHKMHKAVMAASADAFPAPEGMTSSDVDALRKLAVLGICAELGQPGLTSRTQITASTGGQLLDALTDIITGKATWTGTQLLAVEREGES